MLWVAAYQALPALADTFTYGILGLDPASRLGSAVGFFLYDVPKILLLLAAIVFLVGILRSFFSPERTRKLLGGKREGVGNVLAATLGIATPFCSCSAVPLFLGFVESGVPLGVTFSFLIAAPMINEVAVVMLFGLFGWQVAVLYITTGLTVAILAGWVIGRLRLEKWVEEWVYEVKVGDAGLEERLSLEGRVSYATQAVKEIVGKVWPYVVVGIAIGAIIHGYVPEDFMTGIMGKNAWWSVPAAVAVGIPMYSNAAGIIPVVEALVAKGAALGTVLAFMMAVVALSLPEMIILRRVLKPRLIAVFVGVVGTGIVLTGYLFNIVV
ncbi:MAG TPA: permease [Chloroflexota bacterium]|nr:permease [Chloroflexota bacterium]